MKTVLDIVKAHLEQNGYGGLADPGIGCGCLLRDLHTCGTEFHDCQPAYDGVDKYGNWYMYLSKDEAEASKQEQPT